MEEIIRFLLRKYNPLATLMLLISGITLYLLSYNMEFKEGNEIIKLTSFLFTAMGIILLLMNYLQGYYKSSSSNNLSDLYYKLEKINNELRYATTEKKNFQKMFSHIQTLDKKLSEKRIDLNFDAEQKNEIVESITRSIHSNITNEFLKSFEEKYSPTVIKNEQFTRLLRDFDLQIERLSEEEKALSRKTNSNLAFGTTLTFFAMGALAYVVLNSTANYSDVASVLSYYIPRLSFIVFIEVFGYFFLKLYKTGLNDIKYYQNELTNVESKIISLKSALLIENNDALKSIISELSKTERNFILKKGETTVDLEKIKIENKRLKDILNIPNIMKKLKD